MNGMENAVSDVEAHVNGNKAKDLENNDYQMGVKVNNEDEVVDPEILAAIAASKQDLEEEDEDPAVREAIEASKREIELEKAKNESKGPSLLYSTLGKNDEDDDENNCDDPDQVDEPGDLDPEDDAPSRNTPPNGKQTDVKTDVKTKIQWENEEKLTPTLRRAYITKVKPEKRYCSSEDDDDADWGGSKRKKKKGPAKKTASTPAAKRGPVVATGPSSLFKCPNCALTVETIGQLNVHKHSDHGEEKPSVLDMGEAVIARLQDKAGSPKDKILKEILTEFADVVEDKEKLASLLGIAMVEGIEFGRLRQGTSGKKNWNNYWLQENAKKRKQMMDKWLKEPGSVGDTSSTGGEVTVNIVEGSGEYMAIKEKLQKYNIQVTTPNAAAVTDPPRHFKNKSKKPDPVDDDDDIEIVSEKISHKTKLKILHRKKMQSMKPKAVIRVNSSQGKQMLKTISKTGKIPSSLSSSSASSSSSKIFSKTSSKSPVSESSLDKEDEDDGLSCPTCFSAFWYPSQTYEHMSSVHNIENPEKYMQEKKRSRI